MFFYEAEVCDAVQRAIARAIEVGPQRLVVALADREPRNVPRAFHMLPGAVTGQIECIEQHTVEFEQTESAPAFGNDHAHAGIEPGIELDDIVGGEVRDGLEDETMELGGIVEMLVLEPLRFAAGRVKAPDFVQCRAMPSK
jgi:hypothetical protein